MDGDPIHGPILIFKNSEAFISFLSVAFLPLFNIVGPPHPWIFHPIYRLSTSNRTDEYVQRPMDGDYPRVACNRAGEIVAITALDSLPFVEPW